MPHVRIEVVRGWAADLKPALIKAVHGALVEALRIPTWDRVVAIVEHEPEDFAIPPRRGPRFTVVSITLFSGRTIDAKRALYRAVVGNLAQFGVPADDVVVVLNEQPRENWGVRGGVPASEIELGFKVDV